MQLVELQREPQNTQYNITSFYGFSCANNGKDARNTPATVRVSYLAHLEEGGQHHHPRDAERLEQCIVLNHHVASLLQRQQPCATPPMPLSHTSAESNKRGPGGDLFVIANPSL
eukprot:3936202-Pyramimonas_sp.AAC.2